MLSGPIYRTWPHESRGYLRGSWCPLLLCHQGSFAVIFEVYVSGFHILTPLSGSCWCYVSVSAWEDGCAAYNAVGSLFLNQFFNSMTSLLFTVLIFLIDVILYALYILYTHFSQHLPHWLKFGFLQTVGNFFESIIKKRFLENVMF